MSVVADERHDRQTIVRSLLHTGLRLDEAVDGRGRALPWVLDCRPALLDHRTLAPAASACWRRIARWHPEVIAGPTLSADPLIAGILYAAADAGVSVRGAIVRPNAKSYGLRKVIEGADIGPGTPVAIVDDVLNSGKTLARAVRVLRARGAHVTAACVLVNFGAREGRRALRGIPLEAVLSSSDLGLAPQIPSNEWSIELDGGRGEGTAWSGWETPPARMPLAPESADTEAGVCGERIWASCSEDGWLQATDADLRWRRKIGAHQPGVLVALEELIVAAVHTRSLLAIERGGGARWAATFPAAPCRVTALEQGPLAVVTADAALWVLAREDGRPLARRHLRQAAREDGRPLARRHLRQAAGEVRITSAGEIIGGRGVTLGRLAANVTASP
jgi:orotate phosphoribosyltransferase